MARPAAAAAMATAAATRKPWSALGPALPGSSRVSAGAGVCSSSGRAAAPDATRLHSEMLLYDTPLACFAERLLKLTCEKAVLCMRQVTLQQGDLLSHTFQWQQQQVHICRWAAGHLSDAPELTPLTLLGDFVTQPGKPPAEEVDCCATRLRCRACEMRGVRWGMKLKWSVLRCRRSASTSCGKHATESL